jgi:hypothetical protein
MALASAKSVENSKIIARDNGKGVRLGTKTWRNKE